MSRRTRAWQILVSVSLLLGCNKEDKTNETYDDVVCSKYTTCPAGYKCTNDPGNPQSTGVCLYQECGLTDHCKKPQKQCPLDVETAMCDSRNNDKYCECIRPNSEEVPATPTTGGPPTTGKP